MKMLLGYDGCQLYVGNKPLNKLDDRFFEASEEDVCECRLHDLPWGFSLSVQCHVDTKNGMLLFTARHTDFGVAMQVEEWYSRGMWNGFFGLKVLQEEKMRLLSADHRDFYVLSRNYDDNGCDICLTYTLDCDGAKTFKEALNFCKQFVYKLEQDATRSLQNRLLDNLTTRQVAEA